MLIPYYTLYNGFRRPWFLCPGRHCRRRVTKLYLLDKYFLCRHCSDLAYASQRQGPGGRHLLRAEKIGMKLGGHYNAFNRFPSKPKGMHWQMYSELREKAQTALIDGIDMIW